MEQEEINKLVKLVNSNIKNIKEEGNNRIIEFENGQVLPIYGEQVELDINIPTCNFCGNPGNNKEPLFSIDDKSFICKECVILALETYIEKGINIDINISDSFSEVKEQLQKLSNNIQDQSDNIDKEYNKNNQ
ncbi:MAG: ClpX C4-type zinc finger protein [bacterium]